LLDSFNENMTAGRGCGAPAAPIFGNRLTLIGIAGVIGGAIQQAAVGHPHRGQ